MDNSRIQEFVDNVWQESIIPSLIEYIKIPNKSPMFDKDWYEHGYMSQAVELIGRWCQKHAPKNMRYEVFEEDGRTPVILMDIPGETDETILLYGHLDKQPEMVGWDEDLGPWKPVIKDDKLYGRGGADDGYAAYASLTAINALQQQGIPHARCVVLIEASEESGSVDLPFYIDKLKDKIGVPSLVICLDSGCGDYEHLWMTSSLRGNIVGNLTVETIYEGVHSGKASGIVPDTFRVINRLLSRIEDPETGEILLPELKTEIPPSRIEQAKTCAEVLGDNVYQDLPFCKGAKPVTEDNLELILNGCWRAQLTVTGASGLPALMDAGNVMRPQTTVKLSLRTPPVCDIDKAIDALKQALTIDPPYGAKVTFDCDEGAGGYHAPLVAPWLETACEEASQLYFNDRAVYMGEGGTIPFMGMLGEKFPQAQFMITGLLGPKSNAHGPNEFLHIPMGKKLTASVAHVIYQHFNQATKA